MAAAQKLECGGFPRTPAKRSAGFNIRLHREFAGLSQDELADILRIDAYLLRQMEANKLGLDIPMACALAKALHCHPGILLFPDWDS